MVFFTALLIVGPWKINTKHLRQTFGERFLMSYWTLEFSNEFDSLSIAFATLQTYNSCASCEWRDHVSSPVRVVCVAWKRSWSRDRSVKFRSWLSLETNLKKVLQKKCPSL
jgi:hypothetical protein